MTRHLRRWGVWVLLLIAAATALAVGAGRTTRPTPAAEAAHIATLVRCPVCNGETVAASQAAPSVEIRDRISQEVSAGQTQSQILSGLVADYGPGILEKPRTTGIDLLVWLLPAVGALIGAVVLVVALRRWRRAESPPPPSPTVSDPLSTIGSGPVAARIPARRARWGLAGAGTAVVAGLAAWAAVAATSSRSAGAPITGGLPASATATGPSTSANMVPTTTIASADAGTPMDQAAADAAKGNVLGAVKIYQSLISKDPKDVDALTAEGWLLAQTGQPALLQQGVSLLARAEKISPTYGPAHVYRGIALLSEDDFTDSISELQYYLAHHPDPTLVPAVQKALSEAQAASA